MSDDLRELEKRCWQALHRSRRGRSVHHRYGDIAARIHFLRQLSRDHSHFKKEEQALGPALVQAAVKGDLSKVAKLIDRKRNPVEQKIVFAYFIVFVLKNRRPLISEVLEQLGINTPKRTEQNQEEWQKVHNRETVIRRILKRYGLGLLEGKRGRRW
jgi:hypothetical protein